MPIKTYSPILVPIIVFVLFRVPFHTAFQLRRVAGTKFLHHWLVLNAGGQKPADVQHAVVVIGAG